MGGGRGMPLPRSAAAPGVVPSYPTPRLLLAPVVHTPLAGVSRTTIAAHISI